MRPFITVVTGMPRSGTSMLMRMLQAGGIPALADTGRAPDAHNPHGYFEYQPVKRLAEDTSWLKNAPGKAVKIIYRLLPYLPPQHDYRIVFMERDLSEVFESQREMLLARGDAAAGQPRDRTIAALETALRGASDWLDRQPDLPLLRVPYADAIAAPTLWCDRISYFLGGDLDQAAMAAAIDSSLYRHRTTAPL